MNLSDMSLAELFALSDEIGDKYLDSADAAKRDAELAAVDAEVNRQCDDTIADLQSVGQSLEALADKCNSLLIP